jgi:hypothetical protein
MSEKREYSNLFINNKEELVILVGQTEYIVLGVVKPLNHILFMKMSRPT